MTEQIMNPHPSQVDTIQTSGVTEFVKFQFADPDEQITMMGSWRQAMFGADIAERQKANVAIMLIDTVDQPMSFLAHEMMNFKYQFPGVTAQRKIHEQGGLVGGLIPVDFGREFQGIMKFPDESVDILRSMLHGLGTDSDSIDSQVERYTCFWSSPEMAGNIQHNFGVDMLDCSLQDQLNVINFVIETPSNSPRLQQIRQFFEKYGPDKGMDFISALQFGSDFGDMILKIDEIDATGDVAEPVFSAIAEIHHAVLDIRAANAWGIAEDSRFEQILQGFQEALKLRTSEMLSPIPDLLRGKSQEAMFYRGGEPSGSKTVETASDIVTSLRALSLAMSKIASIEQGYFGDNTISNGDMTRFESTEPNGVAISIRPWASESGEARVAWTVSFSPDEQIALYGEPIAFTAKGNPKNTSLTIRLDLEEPTGALSLDIGGTYDQKQPLNQRVATTVSLGAQHLARQRGEEVSTADYHVRTPFEHIVGHAELFGRWAESKRKQTEIVRNHRTVGSTALKVIR